MEQSTSIYLAEHPFKAPVDRRLPTVWLAALTLSLFGSSVLFAASAGVNWTLACLLACGAFELVRRWNNAPRARGNAATLLLMALTSVAFAVTSEPLLILAVAIAMVYLGALVLLGQEQRRARPASAATLVAIPFAAARSGLTAAGSIAGDTLRLIQDGRYVPVMRGLAWAFPLVLVFFLLLSGADPTLEALRGAALEAIRSLAFLPRGVFFLVQCVALLGLFAIAARHCGSIASPPATARAPGHRSRLERTIILAAVAGLFTLFIALRIGALLGNPGARPGSGISYADAVHRGTFELTLVVTITAALLVNLERTARRTESEHVTRALSLTLVAQCLFMLFSAWQRLAAYEAAYGYTVLRSYLALYLLLVGFALVLIARSAFVPLDPGRLYRRIATAGLLLMMAAIYFNVPAWVVTRNIDRYASSGRIDVTALTYGLGPEALPALQAGLPRLAPADVQRILCAYRDNDNGNLRPLRQQTRWFEWNLRRERARAAFLRMTQIPEPCTNPETPR